VWCVCEEGARAFVVVWWVCEEGARAFEVW